MEDKIESVSFMQKLKALPLGILPTMMGLASISTAWLRMGFPLIWHISMIAAVLIWILYIVKLVCHFKACACEYQNTVTASMYSATGILLIIITPWLAQWFFTFAQILHYTGVALLLTLALYFTYRHVRVGINPNTFLPTWFVTYVGPMISNVVGVPLFIPVVPMVILIYGITLYFVLLILLLPRLRRHPIPEAAVHSRTVMIAPAGLVLIGYLNVMPNPHLVLAALFYLMMFTSLIYVVCNTPKFFVLPFFPGYAALTFPMAAGTLASFRMSDFLLELGHLNFSAALFQLAGIQMYVTTGIITFVIFNFARMGVRAMRPNKVEAEVSG